MCYAGLPRYWVHLTEVGEGLGAGKPQQVDLDTFNLILTHNPQKAGHCGLNGVSVLRMGPRAGAGAVRSLSQGQVPVTATAARAGLVPTVRFLVGPSASILSSSFPWSPSHTLPFPLCPLLKCQPWIGVQDEASGMIHLSHAWGSPTTHLLNGLPFGGWGGSTEKPERVKALKPLTHRFS